MQKIINFFIKYKVWTNVLLFSVIGFGILFFLNLKYSFFPEISTDIVSIQVVFPGSSPEEVEEGVVLKIEENIDGIEGIERVTSVSRENFGSITVEILKGYDVDKVLIDIKNAIDRINSFPVGIEKPVIFEQKFRTRTLSIALYGSTDLYNLKYIAENFRDRLLAEPEISQVNISGIPNLEFSIELSEKAMRKYNITFNEISAAVAASNLNISGGKFETPQEEILIRAWGRNYYADELSGIIVRSNSDGSLIRLEDVAEIKEQFEDSPERVYYNNKTSAVISIDKTESEDILEIAEIAKGMVLDFNNENSSVKALVLDDRTISLNQRIELLIRNGIMGLFLVVVTLGFFLNLRLSFWVSIGIPFSFAGMFIVAQMSGLTINVISLFGMIIVIGILVDDAIVVGENIYAHYEKGKPALKAAQDGAFEMLAPVFTSVTTTVIAFIPFFFLDGTFGKFIWHMALVVIASLIFSLIEAFLILPNHLAHSKGLHPHRDDAPLRKKIEKVIDHLTYKIYAPVLKLALDFKWIVIVTPIALFLITIGLLRGGIIPVTFFPFIDGDTLPVNVSLVPGRQEATTDSLLQKIEKTGLEVNEEIKKGRDDGLDVITGIQRETGKNDFGESGSHTGKVTFQLLDGEQRNMESMLIASRIRQKMGELPGVNNISYGRVSFFGKPISVSLMGNDLRELGKAQELLFDEMENFSTLKDVTISNQEGRRELNIKLKPLAKSLGLTLRDVAGQVRQGFFGQEVQRIQRHRDEIRVWVRYSEEDRSSLGLIDRMRIRTNSGREYPFSELAEYTLQRGINEINRLDNMREIKVEAELANLDIEVPPILRELQEDVLPRVLAQVQGVRASFEGQSRVQQKMSKSIAAAFPMALLGMFILVILVFRSYIQAGLIFSLIPIAILGAIWGHGIQGLQLNMLSLYGVIALVGIIVNDSIVLVDQVNRNLRTRMKIREAVYEAALSRLRPILLTTITTAVGLGPIIFETSRQAQFLIPMAVSVAYGLIFGTFILLVILPAGYMVINRIRFGWANFFGQEPTPESVEPAVKELNTLNP